MDGRNWSSLVLLYPGMGEREAAFFQVVDLFTFGIGRILITGIMSFVSLWTILIWEAECIEGFCFFLNIFHCIDMNFLRLGTLYTNNCQFKVNMVVTDKLTWILISSSTSTYLKKASMRLLSKWCYLKINISIYFLHIPKETL